MKRTLIAAVIALSGLSSPVLAHAMLDHSNPPVGSTVSPAPRQIVLSFTQDLEPAFCQIEVRNEAGVLVSAGKAQADGSGHAQLRVPLKALPPGSYKVNWRVLSVDTHKSQGNFTFRVGP
jgi:hypothetical protein